MCVMDLMGPDMYVCCRPVRMHMDLETNMKTIGKRYPFYTTYEVCYPFYATYKVDYMHTKYVIHSIRHTCKVVILYNIRTYVRTKYSI